ncbi:carbohydrate ABC transporter permease [Dactylosporangium sucinum]|uniref:Glycerol-3-phosphate ABC transporter permease n=1 Tax=Dactylosporangium sucinum TaxID=1424081 RepID=A0A917TSF2_9ACTN|nr:sugar ABC transporter permease [Dactylosporangium sucinum]GGM36068.1 glycerol-3-phosphate ABC transporter permease [Dactylosporangium sucinum]
MTAAHPTTTAPAPAAVPPAPVPAARRRSRYRPAEIAVALAFLVPSTVIFVLFVFYPLLRTVWLSVHGSDIFGNATDFVGLDRYQDFFGDPQLRKVLLVTVLFALCTVLPTLVLGLGLALALQSKVRGIGFFRTLMATPFAFSAASAAVVFDVFYSPSIGVFNGILSTLGVSGVEWLTDPATALPSLALVSVWRDLGYAVLVFSAGLQAIPEEYLEAARLDGAGRWRVLRGIVLPLLTPTIFFMLVVSTIGSLQTFGEINILTGGGPDGATTTLVYGLYKSAFAFGASDYGLASVQGVVLLLLVTAITTIQFRVLQRKVFYS